MKIAFLFSGQGAQYIGMMKDLFDTNIEAQNVFEIADKTLDRKISDICFYGTEEELSITHNTQPCVLASDLSAYAAINSFGIVPDAVAGFSVGEYAAIVAVGVLGLNDIFPLIQKRADYMQGAVPIGKGTMAAINKLTPHEVELLCNEVDGYVVPVNYNSQKQIVVSGESTAIDKLIEIAEDKKVQAIRLNVSAPFHCDLMEPAAQRLKSDINELKFNNATIPIYMNVDGLPEEDGLKIKDKVLLQTKSPVRWLDTIMNMANDGIDTYIELGPGKTLTKLVKRILGNNVNAYNITDKDTLMKTVETIKKM